MNLHSKPQPMRLLAPDLLASFAAIVGAKYAITDKAAQEPYLVEMRDLFHGQTPVVLRPGSVDEVAAILKLANETKTAIVPQGGNTGLVGGQISHHGEVVLSLTRLDKIREVDPVSNTMTVEAGVTLQRAREAAAAADRLYPQLLPSEGSCTIGGNLSTNAGGTAAIAHGIARSHALGLEVVLADGRVLHNLNKLKKDNTGYDLKNLFIGSEGTLGIITAAVLRLVPRPRSVETAFAGVPSPQAAVDLLGIASERTAGGVTSFELMLRAGVEAVVKFDSSSRMPLAGNDPWFVLIELSSQAQSGSARGDGGHSARRAREGPGARRHHRRQRGARQSVLAHARNVRRSAAAHRRLDQARRVGAGRGDPGFHRRSQCGGDQAHSGQPSAAVRPCRRRQYPLQRDAARRLRQRAIPGALGRGQRRGVRGGEKIRRLDLGRARRRRHEARHPA